MVIYNTEQPDRLQKTLHRIGDRPVQIVYTSEALRGDPPFFSALAGRGMHVRVMGGASLRERLTADPHVELLPAGAVPSAAFLSTLDAFYYRTHPTYFEAFGRVVLEAMLCGIPVVAESRGGYASHIRHGENGFLFDNPHDALTQLDALQADPRLRERIGRSARATAQRLVRDDLPLRTLDALLAERRTMEFATAA